MAYFLKKTLNKKGIYLQIYESFYEPVRGHTAHRSVKPIGYVDELINNGIEDPIFFYKEQVRTMNEARKAKKEDEKRKEISNETPEKMLGYFPLKSINDGLGVEKYLNLMQSVTGHRFSIYQLISMLAYARAIYPCSKLKTFEVVMPKLFEKYNISLNQIYSGLSYIGNEYEKIIEIYNHQVNKKFSFDTSKTYFDCTNFYFEIDYEDTLRRKGPSKENRKDPIVGMGLLLDANQVPMGMKLYPGNESEKPVIRNVINDLKRRHNINGKTIRVADKGLNCAQNIVHALKEGDGYIFSKSVKQLPKVEQEWVLLNNGYKEIKDKDGNLLYKVKECVDFFPYKIIRSNGRKDTISLQEKRVVIYNPELAEKQKYEINKLVEKANLLKACQAKKSEYGECAKYVTFSPIDKNGDVIDGQIAVSINEDAIDKSRKLAGYNLFVSSEIDMSASEIYSTYKNLWRIEETFKVMKSQLDARPVYEKTENSIKGHFLICYIAVLLTRLLQIKILKDTVGAEELFDFFKHFRVVKVSPYKYINISQKSNFITQFSHMTKLPLSSYFLTEQEVKNIANYVFGKI